jgi:cytoskeletal protein CcmA (bactofilin family)
MALWNDKSKDATPEEKVVPVREIERPVIAPAAASFETARSSNRPQVDSAAKESVIASGLTIEGKIEGAGHVRISGQFKGDVHVQGNLTIDAGAKVIGGVRAQTVVIGGELEGNIDAASRVELLQTGILNGDLKAGSLTVAAGSRMRGRAEFGWDEKAARATSAA